MECNLRFLSLQPQLGEADLKTFVRWLAWDDSVPSLASEHLVHRTELIQVVRRAARAVFESQTDWSNEYLVPLFLTAFGLLRFTPQLGNQRAAVLFVEALQHHLANVLHL